MTCQSHRLADCWLRLWWAEGSPVLPRMYVTIRCVVCHGCCKQLRQRSSPCLDKLLSFACVQKVLNRICRDVHLMLGRRSDLYILVNASKKLSLLICVMPSLVYVLWEGGTSPCGHFSLCSLSRTLLAAEHPFLYLKTRDSRAVWLTCKTGELIMKDRYLRFTLFTRPSMLFQSRMLGFNNFYCSSDFVHNTCLLNRINVFWITQRVRPIFFNSGQLIGSGAMCPQIKSIYFLVLLP